MASEQMRQGDRIIQAGAGQYTDTGLSMLDQNSLEHQKMANETNRSGDKIVKSSD